MSTPKYVRLVERLSRGTLVDLNSGWGISGFDVKETPGDEDPRAQEFVKTALRQGKLEEASKAEFEEISDSNDAARELMFPTEDILRAALTPHNEYEVQQKARESRRRLLDARGESGEDAYTADEERRKAAIKAAKELEKGAPKKSGGKKGKKGSTPDPDAPDPDDDPEDPDNEPPTE